MRTTTTGDQHYYYALEVSIRMPCKGTLGVLIEPGLQNWYKWLRNLIKYSTSYETGNRIPPQVDTIDIVACTSTSPSYLHSVS